MIAIQSLLFNALAGYAGVAALTANRVYPDLAPQGTARPFLVWSEITTQQENDLNRSAETGGLTNYRIQINSWVEGSGTRGATLSRELDAQVRLAMIAASGFKSLLTDSRSLGHESQTKLYGMSSDFSVWLRT